jgi:hypothetical protein
VKVLQKVTFREVILAVHKQAILGKDLDEDLDWARSRAIHKNRVRNFRLQLALLVVKGKHLEHRTKLGVSSHASRSDNQQVATEFCLLLQRIDPALYRSHFVRLMSGILAFLRQAM